MPEFCNTALQIILLALSALVSSATIAPSALSVCATLRRRRRRNSNSSNSDVIPTLWRHCCYDSVTYTCDCDFNSSIHSESKKQDIKLLPITSPNMNRFSNFFTDGLGRKFATKSYLNIPPCLKHVVTLRCEIWKSEKWRQSKICIVINDKSHGSIARHLRRDELRYFTTHLSLSLSMKEFLKLVNIWPSYKQNGRLFHAPIRLALSSSKMLISPDRLNNLCITDRNCY